MKKIAIIVLNWNGKDDTLACIESLKKLKKNKNISSDIIIIDNASKDDSVEVLSKIKNIKLLTNKENLGYAAGNNVGIKYALKNNYDYITILNNDTIVDQNLLTEFIKVAEKYPDFGIFTPKIYFAKGYEFKAKYKKSDLGKVIWSVGGIIDWNNVYGTNRGVDEVDNGQYDKISETDFATGACMFVNSETLQKIGMFDEKFFAYMEDLDLSLRIKKSGYKIYCIPTSILWHKVSQSSAIGSDLNDYFITRNRLIIANRYASLRTKFAIVREATRFYLNGRKWQKVGVKDYFTNNFGKGSWQ